MGAALGDLSWRQAGRCAPGAVLAVPLGATEQHGPHLPLSTDTDIAVAVTQTLAAERTQVVAAPPVAYGSSGEHAGFPGTLSIGQAALELLLVELGRSASPPFRRVLLISCHGGNAEAVQRAVRQLREEGRQVRAFFPAWRGDAHAGRVETSLMLELAPERVRLERAQAGQTASLFALMPKLGARGVRAVSPNGVLGDPAGASAAEGRALLSAVVEQLSRLIDGWAEDP